MKQLLNEKGSLIAKSIIFQVAMSIFGIMFTATIIALDEGFLLFAGIFSILFYFALMGAALNEDGTKDYLRVKGNRARPDILCGFKYVLISYIPTLAITLLHVILRTAGVVNSLTDILNIIIRFLTSGMYLSLDRYFFASGDTFMPFSLYGYSFLIYQVFSIIVCGLFYYIGLCGISLLPKKKEE